MSTYQYHVRTWGGFYNKEYKDLHGLEDGDFFFDTAHERQVFIDHRRDIEQKLGANVLMIKETESYHCNIKTVCHRVVEIEGVSHYSSRSMGVNYSFDSAKYFMDNKWYTGFNDYPLGDDFDYDTVEIKYLKEWITGAEDC
tara:strand:- start:5 stop:427 length:423 start_codon:yes stop_codon:yes gene_type:complete